MKVPLYDGLKVQDRALEAPRQTGAIEGAFVDQGSAALAKGAQDVAKTMATIAGYEQHIADADAVTRAEVVLRDAETDFRLQLGSKKGINAKDARAEADKWFDDHAKAVSEGLENERQRRAFNKLSMGRRLTLGEFASRHQAQELENAWVGSKMANIQSSINAMAASGGNENVIRLERGRFESAFADIAAKRGWAAGEDGQPGQYEVERGNYLTMMHKQVLQHLVETDPRRASAYLDKFGGEIDERTKDGIKKELRHSSVKSESLNLSYDLAKVGGLSEQTKAADDLFKAGKIDAETRDATVQRLEHNYTRNKSMQEEGNKAMRGQLQEWVIQNPGKLITDAPTKLYGWAKGNGELATFDSFAQREGRPAERQKELKVRGELLNMAMTDPDAFIAEFKRTQFGDRMDLGINGIKEMQNVAGEMLRGDGKYKTTFNQKTLQDAIPADLLKPANKDKRDAFVALMSEESDRWKKANPGKTPDDAAYKQVVQAANGEWLKVGAIWNSHPKAYELRAKPDENAMPKSLYEDIRKNNPKYSDLEVGQMWSGTKVPDSFSNELKKRGASEAEIAAAWNIKKKSYK